MGCVGRLILGVIAAFAALSPSVVLAREPKAELLETAARVSGLDLSRRIVANPGSAGHDVAGYFKVRNAGAEDLLVGMSCHCADRVELHRIDRSGARPTMITDAAWPIPEAGVLEVRPGGALHLMLMNFDPAKSQDGRVTLELTFRDAGKIRADFVLAADSRAAWSKFEP
ncbi:MAG: hypothetical protein B7Z12_02630 [Caulobacter vibrioides]|jgi:copper(I)-binding protein|uniref:Copper chaperone PCu(A)C n=1 Tax=Caulobacter vibrioides TaxID=155892 RepID=A0A258DEH0_CAUVI|nr:MAG: hypothetical protein B7Z12_02630 [Caulobacter vibrioides]